MQLEAVNPYSDGEELKRLWKQPVRLFRLSNALRQKSCGDAVSFVINRNINFTNKCTGTCSFCSFRQRESYFLSSEEILRRAAEAESQGATEICLQGGLAPEMKLEDYCGMLETIHRAHPKLHLHAFSPMEVMHMSQNSGVAVRDALQELKRSGLGSLPGTAAEILVDRVRERICPDKLKAGEWREIITVAHNLGILTSSTMLFGHVESLDDRLEHLAILKGIQSDTGGFTETVLLPFIPEDNILGKGVFGIDLLDKLKMHALARVALYPNITNIQASWTKLGRNAAAAAIDWGANDLGGTLMDEAIARNACEEPRISARELIELIESRGRKAVQRTTLYQML
ncbi:7,8-didemethyl-8-hydroxy-5-deazariboflavin synthase subunit CofH [archaeon]|nr:7,8-didemethyl-8-hydroxy-5-deazariboflavin synthase subunit CofH [archaeon]